MEDKQIVQTTAGSSEVDPTAADTPDDRALRKETTANKSWVDWLLWR
jgi:hypothetical protein